MGVLLGCVILLAIAPINTNTSDAHFLTLGSYFLAAVVIPTLILGRGEDAVIRFRLLPDRFRWADVGYVALWVPAAWAGLWLYFTLSPEVAQNWVLPPEPDPHALWRLFIGINAVGVWDELFFVMVSFATLRSILRSARERGPGGALHIGAVHDGVSGGGAIRLCLRTHPGSALQTNGEPDSRAPGAPDRGLLPVSGDRSRTLPGAVDRMALRPLRRGLAESGDQLAGGLLGFSEQARLVDGQHVAVFHHDVAVHHDQLDVAGAGAIHEIGGDVVDGDVVRGVHQVHQDEIGPFARLEAAHELVEPERASPVDGRHPQSR